GDPRTEVPHVTGRVEFVTAIAQEPACRAAAQAYQLAHQLQLQFGRHLVIQRLDLPEPVRQMEDIANDHIGAGDVGGAHSSGFAQPLDEGDAHVVDQVVGDLGTDDFPVQTVLQHGFAVSLGEQLRKGRLHVDRKSTRLNSSHVKSSYA